MTCSVCGKPIESSVRTYKSAAGVWLCEHEVADAGPSKMEAKRKENIAKTMAAQREAAMARAEHDARNPEVVITGQPNGEGRSQYDPGKLGVRKETIDRLVEKVQNSDVSKELVDGSMHQ